MELPPIENISYVEEDETGPQDGMIDEMHDPCMVLYGMTFLSPECLGPRPFQDVVTLTGNY